ncbi:uncharacterized protein [Miscanthus floridulus]|uniref:uncharacterized protein n=1 Tax=Miscanthus floridulus TaxID=154761 RepID=UPI00345B016D
MSATYTRWIHHGESADTEVVENLEQQVEGRDHDFGIHVDVADDDYDEDHGVPEMIGELYAAVEAEGQQLMFARVLEDAKKSLSPGSRHSKFSFLSELPKSYDEAKKYLRELGLGCENIHVCPNNYVLFRKRYAKDNVCPVCKASRWQDETGTKRVPHKVLRHFPLLPRLKRIFALKRTSEETQWHQKKRTPVNNVMSHPADGEAWKDFDRREKTFASDPRNLRLALATDGFNPFGNMSTQYSPKSPGKDFDVFLEPLIEDLIDLWKGVRTFDACTGKKFDLRAAVLWCIHDYPALSTLSGDMHGREAWLSMVSVKTKMSQGKTKDTTNARLDLYDMGIRPKFHLQQHGNSVIAPPALYVLGKDQKITFCKFLKGGLVRKDVYEVVAEIRTFFRELCSRNLRIDVVKWLKQEIPLILCKLEKIFPPAFFDVMVHLAVHLPDEALLRGPVQYGWMYMEDIDTRFNRDDGSAGEVSLPNDISVFKHGVTLVGSDRRQYIDDVVLNKLVCLYRADLEEQGARDVDRMVEKGFAKWFKCHKNAAIAEAYNPYFVVDDGEDDEEEEIAVAE